MAKEILFTATRSPYSFLRLYTSIATLSSVNNFLNVTFPLFPQEGHVTFTISPRLPETFIIFLHCGHWTVFSIFLPPICRSQNTKGIIYYL